MRLEVDQLPGMAPNKRFSSLGNPPYVAFLGAKMAPNGCLSGPDGPSMVCNPQGAYVRWAGVSWGLQEALSWPIGRHDTKQVIFERGKSPVRAV